MPMLLLSVFWNALRRLIYDDPVIIMRPNVIKLAVDTLIVFPLKVEYPKRTWKVHTPLRPRFFSGSK